MSITDRGAHSAERLDAAATYRLTRAEKDRLRREALALGLTSQQLFELRMLGQAKPRRRDGRPRKYPQGEELPIAG